MKKTRYSVYKLTIHIIFVVKYRRKVFGKNALSLLEKVFDHTCKKLECELIEFGGESDHVHLLVSLFPKIAISTLVGRLKGFSSYVLRKRMGKEISTKLWGKHLWSPSYCIVSCGGASLDVVKSYVANQGRA